MTKWVESRLPVLGWMKRGPRPLRQTLSLCAGTGRPLLCRRRAGINRANGASTRPLRLYDGPFPGNPRPGPAVLAQVLRFEGRAEGGAAYRARHPGRLDLLPYRAALSARLLCRATHAPVIEPTGAAPPRSAVLARQRLACPVGLVRHRASRRACSRTWATTASNRPAPAAKTAFCAASLLIGRHQDWRNCLLPRPRRAVARQRGQLLPHSGRRDVPQRHWHLDEQSPGNLLSHNLIHDFYYTGMSIGWTWGYGDARASNIQFNHVHHIGDGPISADMGGPHTWGKQPGTAIRNNLWHDIAGLRYGGWGIDSMKAGTRIFAESNVVYRTTHGSFHQHSGETNLLRLRPRPPTPAHPPLKALHMIVDFDSGALRRRLVWRPLSI